LITYTMCVLPSKIHQNHPIPILCSPNIYVKLTVFSITHNNNALQATSFKLVLKPVCYYTLPYAMMKSII